MSGVQTLTINKDIALKVNPISSTESVFINALKRCKSDISARDLAFSFISEDVKYSEAQALAEAAIFWAEDLTNQYRLFARNCNFEVNVNEEQFLGFCQCKNWITKKCGGEITARDKNGTFQALFKVPQSMKIKLDADNALAKMQFLNELFTEVI